MMTVRVAAVSGVAVALTAVAVASPVAADTEAREGLWHIDVYDVEGFHEQGIDGSGITIAVIDDGINLDVPELADADIEVYEPSLCLTADGQVQPAGTDDYRVASHGTAVVSMIVGNGQGYGGHQGMIGVAPKAKILFYGNGADEVLCQVPTSEFRGELDDEYHDDSSLHFAIHDAIDRGADIISVSLINDEQVEDALARALHEGVVVIAGTPNDNDPFSGGNFPWFSNGVMTVGAANLDGELQSFRGRGVVDVIAPGADLLLRGEDSSESWEVTELGGGTSLATPYTAGVVALLMQAYPEATPNQVLQSVIHNTWAEPHELQFDRELGYGMVDLISVMAVDPTQYSDVNPFIVVSDDPDVLVGGPSPEEIEAACVPNWPATDCPLHEFYVEPSNEPTDGPSTGAAGPGGDAGSLLPMLAIVAGALVVLVFVIVVTVLLATRKRGA